jgi:hypothetical protein
MSKLEKELNEMKLNKWQIEIEKLMKIADKVAKKKCSPTSLVIAAQTLYEKGIEEGLKRENKFALSVIHGAKLKHSIKKGNSKSDKAACDALGRVHKELKQHKGELKLYGSVQ